MKKCIRIAALLLASVLSVSVALGQAGVTPDEAKEKLAYSIGVQAYIYGQPLMDT
jgi:hypothetical protein